MPTRKQSSKPETALRLVVSLLCVAGLATATYLLLYQGGSPSQAKEPHPVGREIRNTAELQIALARHGFSPGSIDGVNGKQSRQALIAYQREHQLEPTGELDEATRELLRITEPTHAQIEVSVSNMAAIDSKPESWVERGYRSRMSHNSLVELIAERTRSAPDYIKALNPSVDWGRVGPGTRILTPLVDPYRIEGSIREIEIELSERTLKAYNQAGAVVFHAPVSIARNIEKRPVGQLVVEVRVENPNYTFNPAILSATAAREGITEKFIIQPGPNNPVGTVWIGLNLPSYGIHGTPEPELVGRTESSGCFRLANWNAETLLAAVQVGTRVVVVP